MSYKRIFKKVSKSYNTIRILDFDNNTFTQYNTSTNIGFPFGIPYIATAQEMGYKDLKECYKSLKTRKILGEEIDYKEQRETERIAYIQLGVEIIKEHNRININDFADVCNKLGKYGMNFIDAQEQIIGTYLHIIGEVLTW